MIEDLDTFPRGKLAEIRRQYHETATKAVGEGGWDEKRFFLIMDGYAQAYHEQLTIEAFEQTEWRPLERPHNKSREIAIETAIKAIGNNPILNYLEPVQDDPVGDRVLKLAKKFYQWLTEKDSNG
jgi:hypothetical protein